MTICACCEGKIKPGDRVVHEHCTDVDLDDEKVLALDALRTNWRRVRDECAIRLFVEENELSMGDCVASGGDFASVLYPGGEP